MSCFKLDKQQPLAPKQQHPVQQYQQSVVEAPKIDRECKRNSTDDDDDFNYNKALNNAIRGAVWEAAKDALPWPHHAFDNDDSDDDPI